MIITKLIGGLGNQMFQYAAGRYLSEKLGKKLKLDITSFDNKNINTKRNFELDKYNIKAEIATAEELDEYQDHKFIEKFFHFNPEFESINQNTYLNGYWQSEKYFLPVENILKSEFSIKTELNKINKKLLKEIQSSNSISIHIRRGDYVSDTAINNFHGICSPEYYAEAIEYIAQKVKEPVFYFFSDDPDWVIQNLKFNYPCIYVNCNNNNSAHFDMNLMKNCQHNIIANSSYSWWGAWLNNNPEKIVITPSKWFKNTTLNTKDLIPDKWEKICYKTED